MYSDYCEENYYPPTKQEKIAHEQELTQERINNLVKITREKLQSERTYQEFIKKLAGEK